MQGLLGRLCGRAVRRAVPVSLSLRQSAAAALEGGSRGRRMGHHGSAPSTQGVPPYRHRCWLDGTGHSLWLLARNLPTSLIIAVVSVCTRSCCWLLGITCCLVYLPYQGASMICCNNARKSVSFPRCTKLCMRCSQHAADQDTK